MRDVCVIRLGHPHVNIERVMKVLSSNQSRYLLRYRDSVPTLGNSDLNDFAYSDEKMFALLRPHMRDRSLTLGITSVPLEDNWFLRPNDDRSAFVITTFEVDSLIAYTKKTAEDYLAYQILVSILSSEYFKRSGVEPSEGLLHHDCRGCLFDFCGNKEDLARGLKNLNIDTQCRGALIEGNVPEESVSAVLAILKYMKKPSIGKSVYSILTNPHLSLLIGIGVGIMVNIVGGLLLQSKDLALGFILFLIFTLGVVLVRYLSDVFQWWIR